jgi:osmotically-inducible protein OsmY
MKRNEQLQKDVQDAIEWQPLLKAAEVGVTANEVLSGMKWNWSVPNDSIQVKVEDGWVSLDGAVEWNYQRDAAKNCASDLIGVKGVINNIKVNSLSADLVEQEAIEKALSRSWMIDDHNIQVKVKENHTIEKEQCGQPRCFFCRCKNVDSGI